MNPSTPIIAKTPNEVAASQPTNNYTSASNPLGNPISTSTSNGQQYDAKGQLVKNNYPSVSTTTISNTNKIDQVGGIIAKTDQLSQKGITTDPNTGIATYANGSIYNQPEASPAALNDGITSADTSSEDKAIQDNLDTMKASSDAATADLIANIQQKFAQRKAEQTRINAGQKSQYQNALLSGGVTGSGSSAQYAPVSSAGIMGAQETYGVQQLADLDQQEQDLIAQAKAAQSSNNFKLLEQKNAQIEDKRKEKIAAATKLNDAILEQNKKLREQQIQSSRDSTVADLYSQGVTNPAEMLDYLNYDQSGKKVGDFTLKEVTDSLKSLVPPGLDDLVKTLRTNGAPQDVIQKVLASSDINSAYEAAGNYGAGGSGIIGEYNYYKAQAQAAGQKPMDFNAYQNMDANRKIKIAAAANSSGLTSAMTNTALKLSDDYEARSKDYYQQREAYNRILSSAQDPSAAGDLALIFNYMKILDPGSTVREGEFANAQNAGSAFSVIGAKYNKVINGERLTEKQRADFVDRATKLFNGAKNQQDSVAKEFKERASKYGVPADLVVRDTSSTGSNAKDAVKNEEESKQLVIQKGIKDPQVKIKVTTMLTEHPEYSWADVLQILNP